MISGKFHKAVLTYTTYNRVELIRGGNDYFELLKQLINDAQYTLHLQTYIFNDDETGKEIASTLINAAKRGVEVYMVADGYASRKISAEFINDLKSAGIHFRWFNPIFKSRYFYFGRRLHHKIVVADALVSLVGGINITDRYNDLEVPAWLDWALYVNGEISSTLNKICIDIWNKSGWGKRPKKITDVSIAPELPSKKCFIRARVNDWVRGKNQVSKSYIEMMKEAQHSIIIMSSYFLPGLTIKKNLIAAAKRGVNIKLVVAGISDIQLAKQAEKHMYRWVLKNNIELYEYKKTVLHGKLGVYDGKWVTAGSYNINNISAYASIELNLDVLNKPFAKKAETALLEIIQNDCVQVTEASFDSGNGIFMLAWQRICYFIYRVTLYLFTFYFKRQHG